MRLLIIGAGPTGLGAAIRWQELTSDAAPILEASGRVGGLARSYKDDAGFTWDLGSHLQFSHYEYFDNVLARAIPESAWHHRQRSTWIRYGEEFVPYPFQLNLHRLPARDRWRCIQGLLQRDRRTFERDNFATWCEQVFGDGITRLFMRPYNEKLWACPLEQMSADWIAERVAVPDLEQILQSVCLNEDQTHWGPNATFRYPKTGGTGFVWQSVARELPEDSISLDAAVTYIDPESQVVTTSNGQQWEYDCLLSTMPITVLCRLVAAPQTQSLNALRSTQTHIVGVGLKGSPPPDLNEQCWSYFPQADVPFYRMTVLSNLSDGCVPDPERNWSLMLEVSERDGRVQDGSSVCDDVVQSLQELQLIEPQNVVSVWQHRLPLGYPVPTLDRDSCLAPVHQWLEARNIYSRGRFGAWKYEVSNQDHSFMQGVELVDRLLLGGEELTLNQPDLVNARYNPAVEPTSVLSLTSDSVSH